MSVKLLTLVFLLVWRGVWGQWHSFGGGPTFGHMMPDWRDRILDTRKDFYDDGFFRHGRRLMRQEEHRTPCPRYKRVETSEWNLDAARRQLVLDIALPDVIQRSVRLASEDANSLRVKGLREITVSRACLSQDAKITEDGDYEILEATMSVPEGGDAQRAQMSHVQGGVRLYVPYTAPCPQYESVRASEWKLDASAQHLALDVALPNVIRETVRASLEKGDSVIRVKGSRKINARRSCLPQDVKVTADGEYEVLEVAINVPEGGNSQRAQLRNIQGGVRLDVPYTAPCPQYEPIQVSDWERKSGWHLEMDVSLPEVEQHTLRTWIDTDKSMIYVRGLRIVPINGRECLPEDASITRDGLYEILEVAVPFPKGVLMQEFTTHDLQGGVRFSVPLKIQAQSFGERKSEHPASHSHRPAIPFVQSKELRRPEVVPVSDIIVEDVPYDWAEKNTDAAEGYFDVRGVFQEY